jgi:hypothetical protein
VLNSNRENVMTCVSLTTSQGGSSGRWREQNLSRASFSDNAAPGGFAQGDDDNNNNGNENDENSSSSLVELRVQKVVQSQRANASSVLYLSVKDGSRRVLPVYVGDAECAALEMELSNKRNTDRPISYDLFKSFITTANYQLKHVVINDLVSKTYHARCFFHCKEDENSNNSTTPSPPRTVIELDSRPSDALNLAVRFDKPIYVTRGVLDKAEEYLMSKEALQTLLSTGEGQGAELPALNQIREAIGGDLYSQKRGGESGGRNKGNSNQGRGRSKSPQLSKEARVEIETSVRNLLMFYVNPNMVELQARLQVAVREERFEDAAQIRDSIDLLLNKDRMAAVCVAMESAINDKRFEEAAVLRNTFLFLKEDRERQRQTTTPHQQQQKQELQE